MKRPLSCSLATLAIVSLAHAAPENFHPGTENQAFGKVARFINMYVEAGDPVDQIHLAIVVHGGAYVDLTTREGNATAPLIAALVEKGVIFLLFRQTAAFFDITSKDLLPGVDMALSAMTAHAQLQQSSYTINPF